VTYKSPDALYFAVDDLMANETGSIVELREKREAYMERLIEILGSTEYVDVEVDLEAGTATVKKVR